MAMIKALRKPGTVEDLARAVEILLMDHFGVAASGGCGEFGADLSAEFDGFQARIRVTDWYEDAAETERIRNLEAEIAQLRERLAPSSR